MKHPNVYAEIGFWVDCGNCGDRIRAMDVGELAHSYAEHMRNGHTVKGNWHLPEGGIWMEEPTRSTPSAPSDPITGSCLAHGIKGCEACAAGACPECGDNRPTCPACHGPGHANMSMSQEAHDAILKGIEERRNDSAFMARLADSLKRNKPILDALAPSDGDVPSDTSDDPDHEDYDPYCTACGRRVSTHKSSDVQRCLTAPGVSATPDSERLRKAIVDVGHSLSCGNRHEDEPTKGVFCGVVRRLHELAGHVIDVMSDPSQETPVHRRGRIPGPPPQVYGCIVCHQDWPCDTAAQGPGGYIEGESKAGQL